MSPYASVVVPTHDRVATLALAVASLQRQTVRDIEIVIAGDGPTREVAEAAQALAAADPRVRFVAFDKGAGAGGSNRDRAVREVVRSERVFYTDDDDLWLPQHVETLGPLLDRFDVADSLPASATLCGRLALTAVNSGWPLTRTLLQQGVLKQMYDTHLAHRRSTYLRLGRPWTLSSGGDLVRRLFGAFAAAADVSWTTAPIATAVSLHGGPRGMHTPAQRRAENAAWTTRLDGWTPQALTAASDPSWQLWFCLTDHPSRPDDTPESYLARLGLALPDAPAPGEGLLTLPLDEARLRRLRTTFALHRGEAVDAGRVAEVAPFLLDTVNSAVASWGYLRRALRGLKPDEARALVRSLPRDDARAAELLALFEAYQLLWARKPQEALASALPLLARAEHAPHEVELALAEIHKALGDVDAQVARLRSAAARAERVSGLVVRLVVALLDAGRLDEAESELGRLETRFTGQPMVADLRRRLDAARARR